MGALASLHRLLETEAYEEAAHLLGDLCPGGLAVDDRVALRELILHPDVELRQRAVALLGDGGDIESVPKLAQLCALQLDEFDHDFVYDAFLAMGEAAVESLVDIARAAGQGERNVALWALGMIGGQGLPFLLQAAEAGDEEAVGALGNVSDPCVVPPLLELLARLDGEAAEHVADCLARSCDQSCIAFAPALAKLLLNATTRVRVSLLCALGRLVVPSTIPAIARCLRLGGRSALAAIQSLERFDDPAALPYLVAQSEGARQSREVRGEVLRAILQHPNSTASLRLAAASLAVEYYQPDGWMDDALLAAGSCRHCQPVFDSILTSSDPLHHLVLAVALGSRKHFRLAASRGSLAVRLGCADLLATMKRLKEFELLAQDRDHRVRLRTIEAVWGLGDQQAKSFLLGFARDRSAKVRQAAAFALALRVEADDLVEFLGPFLFDRQGRPVDPVVAEYRDMTGGVRLVTLSAWLEECSDCSVEGLLEEWRQSSPMQKR